MNIVNIPMTTPINFARWIPGTVVSGPGKHEKSARGGFREVCGPGATSDEK